MKIEVGDRVIIKKTGIVGKIIRITDNPYLPDWLSTDWYHVVPDIKSNSDYIPCRKRQLKLI